MRFCSRIYRLTLVLLVMLILAVGSADAQTGPVRVTTPNVISVPGPTQVVVGGQTFINSGLFGMGRIAAGTRDFNNDSIGAFSGMDILLSTWRKTPTGYTGTLFGLPDRGPNGVGAVSFSNYAARLNKYQMTFTPYTSTTILPASTSSQNQVVLTQDGGVLLKDFNGNSTTGLDPGTGAASVIVQNGIQLPGPTTGVAAGRISLDAEGLRFLRDQSFYVSDEYGSNVYYFNAAGQLRGVIRPPAALLPRDASGALSYTSLTDPVTGRRVNQGIEGMAVTPDGKKLVTLAQSATIQDSTGNQQDRTNTRLMIYDISATRTPTTPIADYVMQLPIYTLAGNGGAPNRTAAQSEVLALNDKQFLVLSRDALGLGQTTGNSVFKSVMLVDVSGATNIAGTSFETTTTSISPGGVLNSTIQPVQQVELINMLNLTQLTKFGENLNNVTPTRLTLGEKWEGMALVPVLEESAPQDFFLFVGNDNDFLSTTCSVNSENCSQSVDSDAHIMVYRLTLPTYVDPEYYGAMVTTGPIALGILDQSATGLSRLSQSTILAHMNAVRRSGPAPNGLKAWASGNYGRRHWDNFAGAGDTRSNDGLGMFGVDYGINDYLTVGGTLSYGQASTKAETGFGATTSGFNYGANARYLKRSVFLNMAYTYGSYDARDMARPSAYGLTATGETNAGSHSLLFNGGFTFDQGPAKVSPFVDYRYVRTTFDAYTENAASGGNLAMPEHRGDSHVASLGAEAAFDWRGTTPVFRASYNHVFAQDPSRVTLKLASATAAIASEDVVIPVVGDDFVSAGLGFQKAFSNGLVHVGYAVEFGDHLLNHTINAGFRFKF